MDFTFFVVVIRKQVILCEFLINISFIIIFISDNEPRLLCGIFVNIVLDFVVIRDCTILCGILTNV